MATRLALGLGMLTQTRFASSGVTGLSKLIVGLRLAADTVRHRLYLLRFSWRATEHRKIHDRIWEPLLREAQAKVDALNAGALALEEPSPPSLPPAALQVIEAAPDDDVSSDWHHEPARRLCAPLSRSDCAASSKWVSTRVLWLRSCLLRGVIRRAKLTP